MGVVKLHNFSMVVVICMLSKFSEGHFRKFGILVTKNTTGGQAVSCGPGWLYNPHHHTCVKADASRVTWHVARDTCSQEKSTLVHVDSDKMEFFIKNITILPSNGRIWIASNDIVEEGTQVSVFRSSLNYTDWRSDQPNDHHDGGPHTQNCVMDVVNNLKEQQDKACSMETFAYICEMWPRDMYEAVFTKLDLAGSMFQNYGLGSEADDISPVSSLKACAVLCLNSYYFCEVYLFSGGLQRCKLLRLYERGADKALTTSQIDELMKEGYKAYGIDTFVV